MDKMITTLISMEDFVLQEMTQKYTFYVSYAHCYRYAQLLKQPPTLGMFVPCVDGKPIVAEKQMIPIDSPKHMEIYTAYHTAKQNCLFEGFEVVNDSRYETKLDYGVDLVIKILKPSGMCIDFRGNTIRTLSDLTRYNLPITQTLINKIYN